MLEIKNLSKSFGKLNVLSNISFTFPDTGLFQIEGKNGSGKTTLLRIIAGLDLDYEGEVLYNDKKIDKKNASSYTSNYVAFIMDTPIILKDITVVENVLYPYSSKDRNKAIECLKKVKLDELADSKAEILSQGERQRLSIARAIFKNPAIIIFDEAIHNLDENNRKIILEIMHELSNNSLVIYTSHIKEETERTILNVENKNLILVSENGISTNRTKAVSFSKINLETIKHEFSSHKFAYILNSVNCFLAVFILVLGSIFLFDYSNEHLTEIGLTAYMKNASGYVVSNEYSNNFPTETQFVFSQHPATEGTISFTNRSEGSIGGSAFGFAYPVGGYENGIIQLETKDGKTLGTYPINENDVLVSYKSYEYCINTFQQQNNLSSFSEAEELFFESNEFKWFNSPINVHVCGFYKPISMVEERFIKAFDKLSSDYFYDDSRLLFGFGVETAFVNENNVFNVVNYNDKTMILRTEETEKIINQDMFDSYYLDYIVSKLIKPENENDNLSYAVTFDGTNYLYVLYDMVQYNFIPLIILIYLAVSAILIPLSYALSERKRILLERVISVDRKVQIMRSTFVYSLSSLIPTILSFIISVISFVCLNNFFSHNMIGAKILLLYLSPLYLSLSIIIPIFSCLVFYLIYALYLSPKDISSKLKRLNEK